ncbi:hypothetical protein V8C40DRAFT_39966 [Trichoderma camerunense]
MMVLCNLDFLRLGRGTRRKVLGTMVLVTCTGSISRYMKARLSQKIKGGLACFVFLLFFSSTFTFFCILGQRGLESSHLRFLSSTAFGRGQGGYVCLGEQKLPLFLYSHRKYSVSPLFFFYSFLSFFHHPLTFAFVPFFFSVCFLLIYTTLSAKQQKRAGWKFETQKNTCRDGEYGLSLKLLKQAAETSWKGNSSEDGERFGRNENG